jgi:hypothetical protein
VGSGEGPGGRRDLPHLRLPRLLGQRRLRRLDWSQYTDRFDTPEEFASWWQTYGQVQWTARQNAINHSLNAIVQSELAWRNAMDDWKAWDLKLVTAQQYSDATVFAHRTLEDAQTAVMRAQNAVVGPP